MSDLIPAESIWVYKGKHYKVNSVLTQNLIQYKDNWEPTVRYETHPSIGLVFYRSVTEFLEKFQPDWLVSE